MTSPRFFAVFGAAILSLSACWTQREPAVIDSASYQAGYASGCAAVEQRGGVTNRRSDEEKNRSEVDPNYRAGWKDGFLACGGDAFRDFETTPGPSNDNRTSY